MFDGKPHYIVRVDENILRRSSLVRWCVADPSGTLPWLEDGETEICVDRPTETRGTYVFAVPEVPSEPQVARAGGALDCVIQRLGAPEGSPSGAQLLEYLRRAASRVASFNPDSDALPPLDEGNAENWCQAFDNLGPLASVPPTFENLAFGPDVPADIAKDTAAGLVEVAEYLSGATGYRLQSKPHIFISADPDWLAEAFSAVSGDPPSERGNMRDRFAQCSGGEANFGVMMMCSESKVFSEDWFGAGRKGQIAFALAHEYFHLIQNELAGPVPSGCCNPEQQLARMGPIWLVEGAAEYIAFRFLADSGRMNLGQEMVHQESQAGKSGQGAGELETRSAFYGNQSGIAVGLVAARNVIGTVGLSSLTQFWQLLGRGAPWSKAFSQSFGLSPEDFYDRGDHLVADAAGEKSMVSCVQGALNSLGFDAGAVDGALGNGTKGAFANYLSSADAALPRTWVLDQRLAGTACLMLAREHELDAASEAIAEALAQQATFAIAIEVDPEAAGSFVVVNDSHEPIASTSLFTITTRATGEPLLQVRLPYVLVRSGVGACLMTLDGWVIKDAEGKGARATCKPVDTALGTLGVFASYETERGTANQ